jgi:hypothetical protein
MTGILRTWQCHNPRCGKVFDSWDAYPSCPGCKNVKVSWVPGGGHVMGVAPQVDADVRSLAERYGLSDLTPTRHGEKGGRAKPPLPAMKAPSNGAMNFGGFVSPQPYAISNDGQVHATCMPAANRIDYKVKATPGTAVPPSKIYPRPQVNTVIEARHTGK